MDLMIKEIRESTGLTQKAFAELFSIPVSTLRKWEQGESSPAPYILKLISRALPAAKPGLRKITGTGETVYYYDKTGMTVSDMKGNIISVEENLDLVNDQNLALYLEELFEGFYRIQEKFNRDCRYDRQENIIRSRHS